MTQPVAPPSPDTRLKLRRFADRAALQAAVETRLQQVLVTPTADAPVVMLSGGTTPIPAYLELATRALTAAPGLTVLFSDDRYVPSDSDQSNYHQSQPLFTSLGLGENQVLRIRTELPLAEATADSERRLTALLGEWPADQPGIAGTGCRRSHRIAVFRCRSGACPGETRDQRPSSRRARRGQRHPHGAGARRAAGVRGGRRRQTVGAGCPAAPRP